MKKLIFFVLFFIAFCCKCTAQLFPTFEPAHFRLGLLYNHPINHFGLYTKIWGGNIHKETETCNFKTSNVKIGAGLSYKFNDGNTIYVGINKNYYYNIINTSKASNNELVDFNNTHKISFDVGISMKIDRLSLLMMSDLLNWESMIGFSYQLHK
jgi:hypothetical protein